MNARNGLVIVFLAVLVGTSPGFANAVAPSASAQTIIYPPAAGAATDLTGYAKLTDVSAATSPLATTASVTAAQTAANGYTDTKVSALNTMLNSDANVTTFANRMSALGLLATPSMIPSVAGLLSAAAAAATYVTPTQVPTLAPVGSVNGQTGAVVLPTYSRQVSSGTAVSTSNGQAVFTFSTAFNNTPTCFAEVQSTNTSYVFSAPQIVSKDRTQVTMLVQATPKTLTIPALGSVAVLAGNPPAATTLNITCIAPV